MPAVFVSPRVRERQLREALQEALQQQDSQALRQLSDRLVHRHGPVQLQRWMQALASEPQQLLWRQALAQPPKPEPQPTNVTLEEPPMEEEELSAVEQTIAAEESAPPVEETLEEQPPAPAPAPIKTALQGWLPQWDGPQTDRLAS